MAEEKLARRFGELVRHLHREKGYSQEEFAFEVGLHQTLGTADRIAKALGTALADLFAQLKRAPNGPILGSPRFSPPSFHALLLAPRRSKRSQDQS